jgi:hypothetical protein
MDSSKISSISLYATMGISVLLSVLFFTETISESLLIQWCYALVGVAAVLAIVFPVVNTIANPKDAKSIFAGIGALLLVVVVSYILAGDEVLPKYEQYGTTASSSKWVSTGLIMFYLLSAIAVGITIFAEVYKIFKK